MQCLYDFTGIFGKNFEEIKTMIPKHINEKGFFGPDIDCENVNEQQFAGNSWYLRYLCEAYENLGGEEILRDIRYLTDNLYVKHTSEILSYVYDPKAFCGADFTAGKLLRRNGKWNLSSDSGCIFIALDGLSHSYKITRDENTAKLIEGLIGIFAGVGTRENKMQAHAFLSGIRGLVRYYEATGQEAVLLLAKEYFDYYLKSSINFVYENFGVINKQCGSEGCAVIDSAMLSIQFYKITGNDIYIGYFRKIYANAIRAAQRANGGFGCNTGVWENSDYLESVRGFAEANWCCTMRGCEGLTYIAENAFFVNGNTVTVILPNDCTVELFGGEAVLKVITDYPYSGKTTFEAVKCGVPFTLKFDLLGAYKTDAEVTEFRFEKCGSITVGHIGNPVKRTLNGKTGYECGDVVLAEALTDDRVYDIDGRKLQRLVSFASVKMEDTMKVKQRVLF